MSISTYTVADYESTDTSVEVTYTNDAGWVHTRTINIPHLENGSIDEEYFQEILEGQLSGIEHKSTLGVIKFIDPNAPPEVDDALIDIDEDENPEVTSDSDPE